LHRHVFLSIITKHEFILLNKILLKQQEKQLKENIKEQKERWKAEKDKLQKVLDSLNPAGGILDKGDGSGRHATKVKSKNKGKEQ
jgi:hypothetical protein